MQRSLVAWFRHSPLAVPYFCMAWIVPFYMVFNHKGYISIYRYFRLRHGYGRLKAFLYVYANHFRFGQIIIDRFAMYAGKRFRVDIVGEEAYNALDRGAAGFVQLSSHVGNYELAGYSLLPKNKSLHVLVFAGETEQVMKGRRAMFGGKRISMVTMAEDMSHIFTLNSRLTEGNIVSIPGDRVFGSPRHVECQLLNAPARLPLGPFALATQRGAEALAVFVMKESTSRYTIYVRRLPRPTASDKRAAAKALAQSFANELGALLRQYPAQWFNFYDFWEE